MKRLLPLLLALALSLPASAQFQPPGPQGGFPAGSSGSGSGGTSFLQFGISGTLVTSSTHPMGPGMSVVGSNSIAYGVYLPRACTLKSISVFSQVAPGAVTDQFVITKNAVAQADKVQLVNAATSATASSALSFAAGDIIGVNAVSGVSTADVSPCVTLELQ